MDIQKVAPELRPYYQYLPAIPFHNHSLCFLVRIRTKLSGRTRLVVAALPRGKS